LRLRHRQQYGQRCFFLACISLLRAGRSPSWRLVSSHQTLYGQYRQGWPIARQRARRAARMAFLVAGSYGGCACFPKSFSISSRMIGAQVFRHVV
jgi:hypothetical protein